MSQGQKTPEGPEAEETIIESAKHLGREAFRMASAEANYSIDEAMRRVHLITEMAGDGYDIAVERFGRDRVLGTLGSAKIGALLAASKVHGHVPAYIAQIALGYFIGGTIGYWKGPEFMERFRRNKPDNENKPGPPAP